MRPVITSLIVTCILTVPLLAPKQITDKTVYALVITYIALTIGLYVLNR